MKLNNKSILYYVFVLGYDLLQNDLKGLENDEAFKICYKIIELFNNSQEFNNMDLSCYDALKDFLENNNKLISKIINKEA